MMPSAEALQRGLLVFPLFSLFFFSPLPLCYTYGEISNSKAVPTNEATVHATLLFYIVCKSMKGPIIKCFL